MLQYVDEKNAKINELQLQLNQQRKTVQELNTKLASAMKVEEGGAPETVQDSMAHFTKKLKALELCALFSLSIDFV
eukprot:SAG11_NODE_3051_length_2727_cov_4.133181_3_plen_76_part_00